MNAVRSSLGFLVALGCSAGTEPAPTTASTATTSSAPEHGIEFQTGWSFAKLSPEDSITIESVVGDRDDFVAGGTYRIHGHYVLRSMDAADLSALVTNGHTDEGPRSSVRAIRGSGTFDLVLVILAPGYPHVTFYPEQGGTGFAGIYFGRGANVLREGW